MEYSLGCAFQKQGCGLALAFHAKGRAEYHPADHSLDIDINAYMFGCRRHGSGFRGKGLESRGHGLRA